MNLSTNNIDFFKAVTLVPESSTEWAESTAYSLNPCNLARNDSYEN